MSLGEGGCVEDSAVDVEEVRGQRGILEIEFHNSGTFMFHAHQSEFTELGWMGFFEVVD